MLQAGFDDTIALLNTPAGQPGSGRVRYAAAMTLNRAGRLSDAALEVFRICSGLDGEDPRGLLAEQGLMAEMQAAPAPSAEQAVRALIAEAGRYLAALPEGPGVAEVRIALAQHALGPVGPVTVRPNAVLAEHLGPALQPLFATHPALAAAIAAAVPHLGWATFDGYPPAEIGQGFLSGNAYCILVGQEGPIKAEGFDFGLFLIAPHVLYRDHHHKAPELYMPLTGPHGWRFGVGSPLVIKPAHLPIWNEPDAPHMIKVGPVPFLCLYGWTADPTAPAHVIPAPDWAALEALRLKP